MPFVFENRVGRLIEVRIESIMTLDEAQQLRARMWLTLGGMRERAVLIGDLQRCELFAPDIADKMASMLKQDNPKVERSALLLRSATGLALQVERLIGEATEGASGRSAPLRRSFLDKQAARLWLEPVLNPEERARLGRFIDAS
jgi:hypothetical protein